MSHYARRLSPTTALGCWRHIVTLRLLKRGIFFAFPVVNIRTFAERQKAAPAYAHASRCGQGAGNCAPRQPPWLRRFLISVSRSVTPRPWRKRELDRRSRYVAEMRSSATVMSCGKLSVRGHRAKRRFHFAANIIVVTDGNLRSL